MIKCYEIYELVCNTQRVDLNIESIVKENESRSIQDYHNCFCDTGCVL
jgi:hypothetical protein